MWMERDGLDNGYHSSSDKVSVGRANNTSASDGPGRRWEKTRDSSTGRRASRWPGNLAVGGTIILLTDPSPSILEHLLKGEGGASEFGSLADS